MALGGIYAPRVCYARVVLSVRLLNHAKIGSDVRRAMHAPTLPTVTGFAARQLTALLRERNVALAPLLQGAGLTKDDVFQRTDRISAAAQSKLLELASDALEDDALGLHLAMRANTRDAGLIFYVASAAKSIGEALAMLER